MPAGKCARDPDTGDRVLSCQNYPGSQDVSQGR